MCQVQSVRLREHPMNSGDGDAGARRRFTDSLTFAGGDVGDIFGDGERGDFHGIVTGPGRVSESVLDFPSPKNLVADGELHGRLCSRSAERRRVLTSDL